VRQNGEVIEVACGTGTSFPQYAALHTATGYLRLNYGVGSGWGTSVVILPSFWVNNGSYVQGAPIAATWTTVGGDLDISFSAVMSGLSVTGHVRFSPPATDSLTATVSVTVSGSLALDRRPNEAWKPVLLSSMRISPTMWDASSAFVGTRVVPIPEDGWVLQPAEPGTVFGLNAGTSAFKTNAPAIEITMDRSLPVTGWIVRSNDTSDDNLALWMASDQVMPSWQYRVRVFKQ
jgi:hypothetical protein